MRKTTRQVAWDTLALLVLVTVALYFRGFLNNSGLHGEIFPRHDEGQYVSQVTHFLNGEWKVRWFINPTFYAYLLYVITTVLGLCLVAVGLYDSFGDFVLAVTLNPYFITLVGRSLSILLSVASVVLVYFIGRRMSLPLAGVTAALALAVNFTHAERGVLAGNEATMVFLLLLFFLFLLAYVESASWRLHGLCGLALGAAIACKYSAGIQLLPLLAGTFLVAWDRRSEGLRRLVWNPALWIGFAVVPLAFIVASPSVTQNFDGFWEGFREQAGFLHEGYSDRDATIAVRGWVAYIVNFPRLNSGLPFTILCGLGLLLAGYRAVRDRRAVLLLAATLPSYLFLGSGIFNRMRFLLPAIPFLFLMGGWVFDSIAGRVGHWLRGRIAPRWRTAVFVGILPLLFAQHAPVARHRMWYQFGRLDDDRSGLLRWARENLEREETYLEFPYPGEMELLGARRWISHHGVRVEELETERQRELFRAFWSRSFKSQRLERLLDRSPTFDDLVAQIRGGHYRYLILVMHRRDLRDLENLPRRTGYPSIRNCAYWETLVAELRRQSVVAVDSRGGMVLRLFRLPWRSLGESGDLGS